MSFGSPSMYLLMLSLPVMVLLFWRTGVQSRKVLERLIAARLQAKLAGNISHGARRIQQALLLGGLALVIVALAKPRYGFIEEPMKHESRDIIVAIDTSRSMLTNDMAPNRLERAKLAAQDLLRFLPGERVALIAFAGTAFLQAPLTVDSGAVQASIDELDTDIIPQGGTNIAAAIKEAESAFGKGEGNDRALIIMTDGEELTADAVAKAREASGKMRIFTIGIGTPEGALIPVEKSNGGTEFVRDEKGDFVKSHLDEQRLREVASSAGGFYLSLLNQPDAMKRVAMDGIGRLAAKANEEKASRKPIERYQWPLAFGVLLLGVAFLVPERRRVSSARRGLVVVALLFSGYMCPQGAIAADGVQLFQQQEYGKAADTFREALKKKPDSGPLRFNAGAAAYKLGKFDDAITEFSKAMISEDPHLRELAQYNLANSLAKRGEGTQEPESKLKQWKDALQHYDQVLKINPKNRDAEENREIVNKAIEDLQKQMEQQKKDQQGKDQQGKDQQGKDQQGKDQQGKDQQGKDQQGKDQQGKDQQGKDQQGKDQQGKDQQGKDQRGKDQQGKDQQGKAGDEKEPDAGKGQQSSDPSESTGQGERNKDSSKGSGNAEVPQRDEKLSGELESLGDSSRDANPGEVAEVKLEKDGEMSERQAAALLESLKGDEVNVPLQERQRPVRVERNW